MGIDKVNRRQGTIQKLIRLGEARIRDQTCFRWSVRGRQLCESFVRDGRVKCAKRGRERLYDKHEGKSVPPFDTTRIRARRIGYGYLVAERSISNKAEKAERAFSYYI